MSRLPLFSAALVLLMLIGCQRPDVPLQLPGGKASVLLPSPPREGKQTVQVRVFEGDLSSVDQPPDQPLWKETGHRLEIQRFLVEDLQYPWGAQVFEFTDEARKELGDDTLLQVALTQLVLPGHYKLLSSSNRDFQGLKGLDFAAETADGRSHMEGRLILMDSTVYNAYYEADAKTFPQAEAKKFLDTLKVTPPLAQQQ